MAKSESTKFSRLFRIARPRAILNSRLVKPRYTRSWLCRNYFHYIYIFIWMFVYDSLCVLKDGPSESKGFSSSASLDGVRLSWRYFFVWSLRQNRRRAVPGGTHENLCESPRPEVWVTRTKDIGQSNTRSRKISSLRVRQLQRERMVTMIAWVRIFGSCCEFHKAFGIAKRTHTLKVQKMPSYIFRCLPFSLCCFFIVIFLFYLCNTHSAGCNK